MCAAGIRGSLAGGQPGSCSCAIASSRPTATEGMSRPIAAKCGGGRQVAMVAIVRDIEERVRLERRLAEEMGNLRSICRISIGAGVMLTTAISGHRGQPRGLEHPWRDRGIPGRPAGHRDRRHRSRDGSVPAMAGRRAHGAGNVYALAHRCVRPASAVQPDGKPDPRSQGWCARSSFWSRRNRAARGRARLVRRRASYHRRRNGGHGGPRAQPAAAGDRPRLSYRQRRAVRGHQARQCRRSGLHGHQAWPHHPSGRARQPHRRDLRAFVRGASAGDDPVPFRIADAVRGAVDSRAMPCDSSRRLCRRRCPTTCLPSSAMSAGSSRCWST